MDDKGFLERLYLEKTELDLSDYTPIHKTDRVNTFLNDFLNIIKDYPPSLLEENKTIPDDLLKKLKNSGIFGLSVDKEYGGMGFNLNEYLQVIEEISRFDLALVLIPLAHLSIGLKGIILYGNESQKSKYLTMASSGEMIFAYALTEPLHGSDAQHLETSATLSDDKKHYILNGQKTYITNGNYAGGLTVFAQLDPDNPGFMGAFIVETAWKGVKIGKDMPKMGLTISSTTAISFKNVKVPVENLLGKPGDGFKIAMQILNFGRLGLGAASIGIMDQSVNSMVERGSKRKQFSVPIKNFQLIQEKIIRNSVNHLMIRALTSFTANILDKDPLQNAAMESSHCKLFGTDKAWESLYDTQQVFGGAGYLKTQSIEKKLRDARVTTIFEGTSEIHSIYPPLFLIKKISRELKGKSNIAKYFYLKKMVNHKLTFKTSLNSVSIKRGVKLSKRITRLIRKRLKSGLIKFGKSIVEKELFLKDITSLSIFNYAIIAIIAHIEYLNRSGSNFSKELLLFDYLLNDISIGVDVICDKKSFIKKELHEDIFRNVF